MWQRRSGRVAAYRGAMSSVTKPRGPLPARTYWVRRLILLGVVAALAIGVTYLVGNLGSGTQPTAAQPSKSPTPSPSASPQAPAGGPCLPTDIVVTPTVRKVHGGAPITLKFQLTGKVASCTWQMSAETLVVKITSGSDRIWSSQECPAAIGSRSVVVSQTKPAKISIVWSGRRSAPDCPKGTPWARIGTYHVLAATVGGEPTDVQFDLVAPKTTVVTKTAKPKPQKSPTPTKSPTKKPKPSSSP